MNTFAADTRPSDRHIHVYVWASHGSHHWRVTQGRASARGEAEDAAQAWACALSGMLGAIHVGRLADAFEARAKRNA